MAEKGEAPKRNDAPPPRLVAGSAVAGGRYVLQESHGGLAGQSFWRAADHRLHRDVALIFVDHVPEDDNRDSGSEVLDRTTRLTGVYSDGLARVLDVIRGNNGGIIIAEWTPGESLAASTSSIRPDIAAAAVRDLADACALAEQKGVAVGIDSPDRIRVTDNGRAVLAFPGVTTHANAQSDTAGLGAILYTLLTGNWPLALPNGSADREPTHGRPTVLTADSRNPPPDPSAANPQVPAGAAVLALRALDGSSVSSAATVRSMIDSQVSPHRSAVPSSVPIATDVNGAGSSPADYDHHSSESSSFDDDASLHRRWLIMAGTGVASILAIVFLATWLLGGFENDSEQRPLAEQLDEIQRSAQASREALSSTTTSVSEEASSTTETPAPATPIDVVEATSWQPATSPGAAENSALAINTIDGDDSTTWSTDTYYAQFGNGGSAFKPGLGLMLTLDKDTSARSLVLESPDEGIEFQVRQAPTASPTDLDDTTRVGSGTVSGGTATVSFDEDVTSRFLLVWVTKLRANGPESYSATVSEITVSG